MASGNKDGQRERGRKRQKTTPSLVVLSSPERKKEMLHFETQILNFEYVPKVCEHIG